MPKRSRSGTPCPTLADDSGITEYTWDHCNRLVRAAHRPQYGAAVDRVIKYAYDHANRSVGKQLDSNGGGTVDFRQPFVYDVGSPFPGVGEGLEAKESGQILMNSHHSGSGDLSIGHQRQRCLWGPAVDQILAEETVDGGTADLVQWTLTDHLNTVRDIAKYDPQTDSTTVVNHIVHDALTAPARSASQGLSFGHVHTASRAGAQCELGAGAARAGNVTSETNPAVDSLFLFTVRLFDADTGLQNNLNRWYDAAVGRSPE